MAGFRCPWWFCLLEDVTEWQMEACSADGRSCEECMILANSEEKEYDFDV